MMPAPAYHRPDPRSASTGYALNLLKFSHPSDEITFVFSGVEQAGKHRFRIDKLPQGSSSLFPGLDPEKPFVYTNFEPSGAGAPVVIKMTASPAIAKAYYTRCIRQYLQASAGVVVTNFLYDSQFWYKSAADSTSQYTIYDKFTVRVIPGDWHKDPALLISYDGRAFVSVASMDQMSGLRNFDHDHLTKVIFRSRLYRYDQLPAEALYHQEEVFALLNRKLTGMLQISLPLVKNWKVYQTTYDKINWFYSNFLNTPGFRSVLPVEGKWLKVRDEDQAKLTDISRELLFGESKPYRGVFEGLKRFGPLQLPESRQIRIFLIYHRGNEEMAAKLSGYLNITGGFPDTKKLTRLPYYVDRELDIILANENDTDSEFRRILQERSLPAGPIYYAFYITPFSKFETEYSNRQIYFRIKEQLLQRGISMQTVERSKLAGNFSFSMANIGIAMIAKIGGVPWRLARPEEKELIIGFGAYRSQFYRTKYIGSAVCFNNEGIFRELDCFPSDEPWGIAGAAEKALMRFRQNNPDVKRMVIHFYKKMGYRELQPIEAMLKKLKFDIPVIIVNINKTSVNEFLVFDESYQGKMPYNGMYFNLGNQQYLLCNNDRQSAQDDPARLPLPVKLGLQCNVDGILDDNILVKRLIQQVYEFSFMHWRSVNQPPVPVTVSYPEMVAKILPWFENKSLPEYGRHSLWFI